MIYELRIYRALPGRMPALLNRFQSTTLRIWQKHGIRQAGFWTTAIGESNNELTYMLAWKSLPNAMRSGARSRAIRSGSPPAPRARRRTDRSDHRQSILQPTAFPAFVRARGDDRRRLARMVARIAGVRP